MVDTETKIIKLEASADSVRGYGLNGREILVANDNNPDANTKVLSNIREPFTRAAILIDQRDIRAALKELAPYERAHGEALSYEINATKFANQNDFNENFGARLGVNFYTQGKRTQTTTQFDALQTDIQNTMDDVAGLINFERSFSIMLRLFGAGVEQHWHVDTNLQENEIAITRALSPLGTLVAFNTASDNHKEWAIRETTPAFAGHGGQSTCVIKKGTLHKTPYVPVNRWMYRINQPAC